MIQGRQAIQKKYLRWAVVLILLTAFWYCLPKPLFKVSYSYVLTDCNGKLLQARIAPDGQWRFKEESAVPQKFAKAIICFEDKRFYYHPGIDPLAMGRAVWLNLSKGKVVSGGSTLSMQVVRLSRNRERNIWQKLIELILTLRLELGYSKEEILTLYANHAPFGGNVVGLQTAAWRYFGRSAAQLSWGEAAGLAVLPNSPALVRPDKNKNILLQKRNRLLNDMCLQGIIDRNTCELAMKEALPAEPKPLPNDAPNLLGSLIDHQLPAQNIQPLMQTTLQQHLQQQVNQILERHHQLLKANGILNAAALVMEVESGEVRAYAGNIMHPEDPETESYVDMIPAARSPGSTLKPLLYAAMLQDGLILPKTLLPDIPTEVAGYSPQNFDLQYDGAVPAHEALQRSLNVPAVRMLQQYRYERFYFLLKQLGIQTLNKGADHYGLSLILGGGENTLWEISGIYASLARMLNHYGRYSSRYNPADLRPPSVFPMRAEDRKAALPANLTRHFWLNAGAVYNTFDAMKELVRPGDEQLWNLFGSSRRIAWKTGTSFGFRDGWAIGITPTHVVSVWVGNADGEGRPGLTGIQTAAPILFDIFRLLPGNSWFQPPYDDLREVVVCRQSGNHATAFCEQRDTLWSARSLSNGPACQWHQQIFTNLNNSWRVTRDCENAANMQAQVYFVLPPGMEWFYRQHHPEYKSLPPWKPGCSGGNGSNMEMIYPKRNAILYVPVEIDGTPGKAVFELAHRQPQTTVYWHLDDAYLGSTREFHKKGLSPAPGKHLLVLTDARGERLEIPFEVLKK